MRIIRPTVPGDKTTNYSLIRGFMDLGAGMVMGLAGMCSGIAIGIAGDAGVRAYGQQPRMYTAMVLILIFGEALAIYGIIIAILLTGKSDNDCEQLASQANP